MKSVLKHVSGYLNIPDSEVWIIEAQLVCLYDLTSYADKNFYGPGRATHAGHSGCKLEHLILFFLILFILRCPLPVISPYLLPCLCSPIFLGFSVAI